MKKTSAKKPSAKKNSSKRSSAKGDWPELFEAVAIGRKSNVERLLKAGADVNQTGGSNGLTPLMVAVLDGHQKLAAYLIEQGADVNRRTNIGQTALMIAAAAGQTAIVQQLVLYGADIRAEDKEKMTAVAWAITRGDFPEVIARLVALGAEYNAPDLRGLTPLMRAARLGFSDAVGVLLTVGADEKIKWNGKTAYELAAERGHKEVCETMTAILKSRPKGHRL
jgi:ankyrin repeat protein